VVLVAAGTGDSLDRDQQIPLDELYDGVALAAGRSGT